MSAPSFARRSTIARPMPWSPPVIAATFPSSRLATWVSLADVLSFRTSDACWGKSFRRIFAQARVTSPRSGEVAAWLTEHEEGVSHVAQARRRISLWIRLFGLHPGSFHEE